MRSLIALAAVVMMATASQAVVAKNQAVLPKPFVGGAEGTPLFLNKMNAYLKQRGAKSLGESSFDYASLNNANCWSQGQFSFDDFLDGLVQKNETKIADTLSDDFFFYEPYVKDPSSYNKTYNKTTFLNDITMGFSQNGVTFAQITHRYGAKSYQIARVLYGGQGTTDSADVASNYFWFQWYTDEKGKLAGIYAFLADATTPTGPAITLFKNAQQAYASSNITAYSQYLNHNFSGTSVPCGADWNQIRFFNKTESVKLVEQQFMQNVNVQFANFDAETVTAPGPDGKVWGITHGLISITQNVEPKQILINSVHVFLTNSAVDALEYTFDFQNVFLGSS